MLSTPSAPSPAGRHTTEVLRESGFSPDEVDALLRSGAAGQAAAAGN